MTNRPDPARDHPESAEPKTDTVPAFLTEAQIRAVAARCNSLSDVSYLDVARPHLEERGFATRYADLDVVEIGPGRAAFNAYFPCKTYRSDNDDGLTFLRGLPDRSAVVVSFGVIDASILRVPLLRGDGGVRTAEDLAWWAEACARGRILPTELESLRYGYELAREIRRVAYPEACILGLHAQNFLGVPTELPMAGMGGIYRWDE